ncbi:chemotaxis response regulator protein-glutamate methylesterase [bacterium F16]|nr:chemotaxis response regulator protein-glutamate methylesterase [bacterium F16]
MMQTKIRVLIVDDSALVRDILFRGLSMDSGIEVVGKAADPYQARDLLIKLKPDVMTLDVEMPRMDGVEFLRKLMPQFPLPVVMVSALTDKGKRVTLEALEYGAVDFVTKPSSDMARALPVMITDLIRKVKIAARTDVSRYKSRPPGSATPGVIRPASLEESTDKVIVIGASTGGTEAIRQVITRFPATMPGVVIVQHMPPGYTRMYAERMDSLCAMSVSEAKDGDRVMTGKILIAPGGKQMRVVRRGGIYQVTCGVGELVSGHCPSVDVVMDSVAQQVGANAIGVMLTGMGNDGAKGMKAMRDAGARTMAQDEASCVVFGMPKCAHENGGAERLVSLDTIAQSVIDLLGGRR